MNKKTSTVIGFFLAAVSCSLLIYAYETNRSFLQIFIAFFILYSPITFISSINGKVTVFLFVSFLIIGGYISYKQHWFDTGFGMALAILLGGATYMFRVSKANTFDSAIYKQIQKDKKIEK